MNFEPNKLALLISLICAGAPTGAFGKTQGTTERIGLSADACARASNLATPQAWPLILNGIRDAEVGSLGLTLSASGAHAFALPWREAETRAAEKTEGQEPLSAAESALVDPLERANAALQIDSTAVTASTPAVAVVPATAVTVNSDLIQAANIKTLNASSLAVDLPLQDEVPQRAALVITPSAQRVMRNLAAIRFPALETMDSVAEIAVAPTAPAPSTPAPSILAFDATLDPAPSTKVLITLNQVLSAAAVPHDAPIATDSAKDEPSLEAAIAARQELKRIKQRARAEQAAIAQAAQTAQTAQAQPLPRSNPFGSERVAVRDIALDRVRGGFVTNNLNIAFGIERAVYINGSLVTTTSLNISDTGRVTSIVDSKGLTPGTLALIQSGAGNSVAGGAFSSSSGVGLNANAIGTVVQNTLDGQKIQNITVINATANSLGVLRDLNLQNSLRSSLIDSLRR